MSDKTIQRTIAGRYSPLRYPGGKGKLARFIADLIRLNALEDGLYVEPYAGGAAVALELLFSGIVRRIAINDINKDIYEFWHAVINQPNELVKLIRDTDVTIENWKKAKRIISCETNAGIDVAFSTFFLNRTNRSGILNGGPIGGMDQSGPWKIDARYNKEDLISRILNVGRMREKIHLTNLDAVEFLEKFAPAWNKKTLVYLDPPYFNKGRDLYYSFYEQDDHANVAYAVHRLRNVKWLVSYDDVQPIRSLYEASSCLRYTIGYSARDIGRGIEAMFFCSDLKIPPVRGSMIELWRSEGIEHCVSSLEMS